ncbi:MAG: hypothetical protein Q6L60_08350 [Thermostichus sp. HHBFW_bins_43]
MRVMVAGTWVGPGIPAATAVASAWQQVMPRPYSLLAVDSTPSEAQLKTLWQQISAWEGEKMGQELVHKQPLLVLAGSLAEPIGPGQTWADLAKAWGFTLLLTVPRGGALSQATAFAALLRQAKAHCLGWVLLGSPPESCGPEPGSPWDPQMLAELDSTLAANLEAQLGLPVLGRMTLEGEILWDTDFLEQFGYT